MCLAGPGAADSLMYINVQKRAQRAAWG
jgi:hypothetical protein